MEFLAPLMLLGAAGLLIPVIIHLIGRRRAKVVRFAALDFLIGSRRKTARRFRLRELLLLIVRAGICLAIPVALAQPFTSCDAEGPAVERGAQAAILVIDDSFAAMYQIDGESLLDRAKRQALSILEQVGPDAEVAVILAAEGSDNPAELSRDHLRLRDMITGLEASNRPADTTNALRRAAQLAAGANHERRTVFLLSVLAATGFHDDPPWPPGKGPALVVVDLLERPELAGLGEPPGVDDPDGSDDSDDPDGADDPDDRNTADEDTVPDNLAITGVDVTRDPSSGPRGVRVTALIQNFGARDVAEHEIQLRINGTTVARGLLSLGPGERQRKPFLATIPAGSRYADIEVSLAPDRLLVDNRRFIRTELREEIHVLLVNGDPHTVRHQDELFYAEAALRPGDRADTGTTLTTATVDELGELLLDEFDVVVLANVRAMSGERVSRIAAWVKGGGGLLLTVGDNVDSDAYNQSMLPLLPQRLKDPIEVTYGSRGSERAERALRLAKWESEHPAFSVFTRDAPGLRDARFHTIILLGPTTRVDDRRVLVRYTNDAAALVEARSGAGRLMLWTSTIDRDWNDLVIHPGYLPLMQQLVRYLARKQEQRARETLYVGRSAVLRVEAGDSRLEISGPDLSRAVIEGERIKDRKYVRFAETGDPGFYRVWTSGESGELNYRVEADFAVNVDPRGSDLRPVPPERLPTAGPEQAEVRPANHKRRVELWHAIAVGLLMLLLVESLVSLR